ncbi:MAG: YbhB/YbcL family Raf kinase inhibitor-like protein [Minisyncoccia bacterium]
MKNKFLIILILLLFLIFILFLYFNKNLKYNKKRFVENNFNNKNIQQNMKISSPNFTNLGYIPTKFTCDGENINPTLIFENIPENTKSLVLIVDDPDAPTGRWIHWLLWNIDPNIKEIESGKTPPKSTSGKNDFGNLNYGGPCPPSGTHRYYFKLYALDNILNLKEGSNVKELEKLIAGHIIEKAELIGLYKR